MNIEVQHKNHYGKQLFYPLSDDAKFLCKVIGKNAFTIRHLSLFEEHGWDVKLTAITQTLKEYLKVS